MNHHLVHFYKNHVSGDQTLFAAAVRKYFFSNCHTHNTSPLRLKRKSDELKPSGRKENKKIGMNSPLVHVEVIPISLVVKKRKFKLYETLLGSGFDFKENDILVIS